VCGKKVKKKKKKKEIKSKQQLISNRTTSLLVLWVPVVHVLNYCLTPAVLSSIDSVCKKRKKKEIKTKHHTISNRPHANHISADADVKQLLALLVLVVHAPFSSFH
jgi:hypothetical protein